MAPEAARDNWLGDENELRRLLDALRELDRVMARIRKRERPPATRHGVLIDIRWRDFWLRIGRALHSYFGGGEQGLQLWIAITAGNSELGLVGCPECFDEVELRAEYASLGNHTKPIKIGTLIDFAIAVGFNAKRSDYGLPALPAKQLEISEVGKKVLAAAQAFQALRQPGKDLRYQVCQTTLARGITAAKVANLGKAPLAVLRTPSFSTSITIPDMPGCRTSAWLYS